MTYEELVQTVKDNAQKVSSKEMLGHIAVQFNIEGEAEGAFYVEFSNGKITVAPYEYFDRDILIVCNAQQAIGMSMVTYDPVKALENREIYVEGNLGRLELLREMLRKGREVFKRSEAKKGNIKKTSAKPADAAKSTSKKTAKKSTAAKKPASKPAKKKTTARNKT